jgi:uncharacterized protein YbcC (UPF0753/DUF2309 family)
MMRKEILHAIEHFEHVLPAQAPIKDFVHHNTLHGYQHLEFSAALAQSEKICGARGYLELQQYRQFFAQGRIDSSDLEAVLNDDDTVLNDDNTVLNDDNNDDDTVLNEEDSLQLTKTVFSVQGKNYTRKDVILTSLLYPLKPVTHCQLTWQIEELGALERCQADVSDENRQYLLVQSRKEGLQNEAESVSALWQACLKSLQLEQFILHPEALLDLSPDEAEELLSQFGEQHADKIISYKLIQKDSRQLLGQLLEQVGDKLTLGGVVKALSGKDLFDDVRPVIIRHISSYLDQGMSAWHHPERSKGFYHAWKQSARHDLAWVFEDLPDWNDNLDALPDDPMDTIIQELRRHGIVENRWTGYLQRLSLELPGWSGMFFWRHLHPGYEGQIENPVNMLDYLAVRLVLERLFAQRICSEHWRIEANLDVIRWYFKRRSADFLVRYCLYNERLPEYLVTLAQQQIKRARTDISDYTPWRQLAGLIWTWQHSPVGSRASGYRISQHIWPLFRFAQHNGITAAGMDSLEQPQIDEIFSIIKLMDDARSGFIWMRAYEHHYREQYFNALVNNHGRGRWKTRESSPDAQLVFCMDDREEGIRRHLEELNPNIETFGAAAFFGLPINWRGLDDDKVTLLCPVVVVPTHELKEEVKAGYETLLSKHSKRRRLRIKARDVLHMETRRNLLSSALLIAASAPFSLFTLIGKIFAPRFIGEFSEKLKDSIDLLVPTEVAVNCEYPKTNPTSDDPQLGYSDGEQAEKVEAFLRIIGLVNGFAPFIVMVGHGSISQNNPHLAAYDCGACSGRHSGPNARSFAVMGNRPEVRALLKERGLDIPDASWFLGVEHNTCDEKLTWYDTDLIPAGLLPGFSKLQQQVFKSSELSAHERCRRLASAPHDAKAEISLKHIIARAYDFSQARPELGHATNAAAFIGRRSATQGAFLDRRVFLISYDPATDPEGTLLERILLTAGPVGAGISLEYYFSTVDNENYGCGSKITHNINGMLGVMDGAGSDLRTGLPRQMIEIHEAMRLQIVVEASTQILTRIYADNPPLQELIGKGWLLLSAKDPDSKAISVFKPGVGFVPWEGHVSTLPEVANSPQWYKGHQQPLSPALVTQPDGSEVRGQPSVQPSVKQSGLQKHSQTQSTGAAG